MIRTQAQLSEEQAEALKQLAAERGVSVAELIRRGVDMVLATREGPRHEQRLNRALEVVGAFADSATDVARRHDEHFVDAIEDARRRPRR